VAEEEASSSMQLTAQSHRMNAMVCELAAIAGKRTNNSQRPQRLLGSRISKEALAPAPEPRQLEEPV